MCLRIRLGERLDYLALRQTLSDTSIVSLPLFDARINPRTEELEVRESHTSVWGTMRGIF